VIGLEVHAQVTSNAKLFSGASTEFGAEPNSQVSLVDAAMPGMLPVLNRECVRQAVRTGMALEAKINAWSRFDRKNYFYADLPQGYQISQLYHPIVGEGQIEILTDEKDESTAKTIGIERIHIEQDAGKLMHDQHPSFSYVDLNRSGVALMEIVSKPDMRSPDEAGAYVRKLRSILRYVGSCDGNMEQGSMRADVNVSVRRPGAEFGTRTETKNVNSVRFIMAAIEYEANRQVDILESGGSIVQETRLFDPDKAETRSLRSKEDAHDYRYFPDPDLLPLELDDSFLQDCRASLPELPDAKRRRYEQELGLSAYNAAVLTCRGRDCSLVRTPARRHWKVRRGDRPGGLELGDLRLVRCTQPAGQDHSRQPGEPRAGRRAAAPGRRRHAVRNLVQAGLRDHARDGAGSRRHRRGAGPQANLDTARSRK
jgi:aspartyl-tRNA(Asn)/glutamyl-tRNA(Gln) amidotransferase subunit B